MSYRVFRATYTSRDGTKKQAAKWYVEFRDQSATVRRLPGFTSKAATEEMGRDLVKLVDYHKATGGQTDPSLARWLAGLPARTREKLVAYGLLDAGRVAAAKPLGSHLADCCTGSPPRPASGRRNSAASPRRRSTCRPTPRR